MIKIYGIRNKQTGFIYIGCTAANLNKRMREHRCLLNSNKHTAILMQSDWNESGEHLFEIIEIERLQDNANVIDKRTAELMYMNKFKDVLYNAYQNSFSPTKEAIKNGIIKSAELRRGTTQSPESNEKRRLAQLGKPKGHGAKISATKRRLRDEIVCSNANK